MKTCSKCGEEKSLEDFYYNRRDKRYYGQCKVCQRAATSADKAKKGPTHTTWRAMVERCTNPRHKSYKYYGAKGVTVCDRWRVYANFLEDVGERPEGLTLDRIDPWGNYEPGNVRWATAQQQAQNRRRTRDRPLDNRPPR